MSLWRKNLTQYLKKGKVRKAADEISLEVWKIRIFDDILLRLCNGVYKQNTIDK